MLAPRSPCHRAPGKVCLPLSLSPLPDEILLEEVLVHPPTPLSLVLGLGPPASLASYSCGILTRCQMCRQAAWPGRSGERAGTL